MRRALAVGVGALLLAAAAVGLVRAGAHDSAATLQQRTERVAAGLRCPTCAGESVAASRADAADSMRAVITEQLRAGRTPAQVRTWFAQRYGDWVLLDPPSRGAGLPLHVLPLVAIAGGCVLLVVATRGRASPGATVASRRRVPLAAMAGVTGVVVLGVVATGALRGTSPPATAAAAVTTADPVARGQVLEGEGRLAEAAAAYQQALRQDPTNEQLALRLGFVLLRTGHPQDAVALLGPLVTRDSRNTQALLLLGLAQRASHDPGARATLQRFLALAPTDPAAGQVRGLLRSG